MSGANQIKKNVLVEASTSEQGGVMRKSTVNHIMNRRTDPSFFQLARAVFQL